MMLYYPIISSIGTLDNQNADSTSAIDSNIQVATVPMMNSKIFDPPVYKQTYGSDLKSSTHSHK